MKRKLGRFLARVSGVLRRVFRWFIPNAVRTEVQLAPPRPEEPPPPVTREVVDLEFEEIRAALVAEPSVSASAPEAPRRPELRPIDGSRAGDHSAAPEVPVAKAEVAPPGREREEPTASANIEGVAETPTIAPAAPEPSYKAPKYGREPKAKAKLAAPRPTPAAPKAARPQRLAEPEQPLEDTAVADLLARVDAFLNMGELPTASPESVIAVEPELLVEVPTVRQQIVEQLAAEVIPAEPVAVVTSQAEPVAPEIPAVAPVAEIASGQAPEPPFDAPRPSAMAERPDPFEFIASMRDGQPPPELVSEPVALAEVLPELAAATLAVEQAELVEAAPEGGAAVEAEAVEARADVATEAAAAPDDVPGVVVAQDADPLEAAPVLLEEEETPIGAAPEAVAAAGFALPVPEEPALDDVVAPEPANPRVEPLVVEPSVDAVMLAEEPPLTVDEAPLIPDDTLATEAGDEAGLVAQAAEAVASAEPAHSDGVEAVAGEAVTAPADVVVEPVGLASVLAEEQLAHVGASDEPMTEAPPPDAAALAPELDGDAAIDAELAAAMAQAEDANTAFAASHPEVAEEPVAAKAGDDDERVDDEPWSPPPVMADAYYEYAMPAEVSADATTADAGARVGEDHGVDEPVADDGINDATMADERLVEPASSDAIPVPPEVAAVGVDESPPPEVAAMGADDASASIVLAAEATIDAVTSAVEETLAAADTFAAATEVLDAMPADADAFAAAAMADVVASAAAGEEKPPAPIPTLRNPIPKVETPTDYVATPESMHALYQLHLDGFEGPLDLLLHLIKRHHLDIFDIPIAFICERYLEYLKAMEDVDIDVASEFLFMAAELLQLKSRMLLPRPEGEAVEEEEVDPRAELVRRLLEYQKYKDVAERFGLLDRFGRDTFGREAEPTPPPECEAPLKEVGLFALVKAFQACLDRQKPEVRHQVMLEQVSVRQRIRVLVQRFESQEPTRFDALLEDAKRRIDIVVTFLALLEMGKLKLLRIFQSEDGVIYVHPKFDDVSLAFARLEGLDESQYAG